MEETVRSPESSPQIPLEKQAAMSTTSSPKSTSPIPTHSSAGSPARPSAPASEEPQPQIQPMKTEAQSPRHGPRQNQRRFPHSKKKQNQHAENNEQSWRAAAWTGTPIVATGPLSSLWSHRFRSESERGERLSKTNVYVRGLPANTTDNDLIAMCTQYGRVASAKALVDKTFSRGYGFIDFESSASADTAVRDLRSRGFFARMAKVAPREGRGDDPTNLYLANLPPSFSESDVECLLSSYGRITSARVLRDENSRSRGVGFARMDSMDSCERAIAGLNGMVWLVQDRPLLVKFADSKKMHHDHKISPRIRPASSPSAVVWWPNTIGYQPMPIQSHPEHMQPLQIPPIQTTPLPHPLGQPAMAQTPIPPMSMQHAAMTQNPMGGIANIGGQPAVYMNYGYRYVSVSSAPPLSSPTMMSVAGSVGECWSPGESDVPGLMENLN